MTSPADEVELVPENRVDEALPCVHRGRDKTLAPHEQNVEEQSTSASGHNTMQKHKTDNGNLHSPWCVTDNCENESEECMLNIPRVNLEGDRENHLARSPSIHRARDQGIESTLVSHRSKGTHSQTRDDSRRPRTLRPSPSDVSPGIHHQTHPPCAIRHRSTTPDYGNRNSFACDPNHYNPLGIGPSVQTQPQSTVYSPGQMATRHVDQTLDRCVDRHYSNACYPRFSERRNASPGTPSHTQINVRIPRTRATPYGDLDPDHHVPSLNACSSPSPSGHFQTQPGVT